MREWERCQTPTLIWQIPGFLLSGLQYAQQSAPGRVSRQLMLEGLILQLFGHGLSVCQDESAKQILPAGGEQLRLERVRRLLEQAPENDYTLNELAQRAAMSSSSLRSKFRQVQRAAGGLDVGLSARHQFLYRLSSTLRYLPLRRAKDGLIYFSPFREVCFAALAARIRILALRIAIERLKKVIILINN